MSGYIGTKAAVVTPGAERKKVFSITTTTTSLTGLAYTPGFVHVFHNGVRLVDGTDYTATNGTSLTLTTAAQNGDEVVVISYATFQTSDTVSASAGGTFSGDITVNGSLSVDSPTFVVDAASNNVGIGTSSPSEKVEVNGVVRITGATTSNASSLTLSYTAATGASTIESRGVDTSTRGLIDFYQATSNGSLGQTAARIDSAGRVTMPYQPAFRVNAATGQVLGGGWQTVSYNNSLEQRGSFYNTSTSRFTAPVSGWYQFNAQWAAINNADTDGTFSLAINGSTANLVGSVSMPNTGGQFDGHVVSGCCYLAANDYVTVIRYSDVSTTTRSAAFYGGWFSGYLIG